MKRRSKALATLLALVLAGQTLFAQAAPPTPADFSQKLDTFLSGQAAQDAFSGAVLVAKGDQVLFRKAYGMASREHSVANKPETRFNLGSINKIFTQVAVVQLVRAGKLNLDDSIGKLLPDYPNDAAKKITVWQLLSMTSGLGDFFNQRFEDIAKDKLRKNADYLPLFASDPLKFAPGTGQEYSNAGYVVLGLIIEKVSGQDYYEYVKQNIFVPNGMTSTDSYQSDEVVPDIAMGYSKRIGQAEGDKGPRQNVLVRPARGSAAGGGYSTVDDLLKFARAVASGKIELPETQGAGVPKGNDFRTHKDMGIAGGSPGVNSLLVTGIPGGYTVVVMCNQDPPIVQKVMGKVRETLQIPDED